MSLSSLILFDPNILFDSPCGLRSDDSGAAASGSRSRRPRAESFGLLPGRESLDAELGQDRPRQILKPRGRLSKGPAGEKDAGDRVGIHAVVPRPLLGVVAEDFRHHFPERRLVGSP